MEGGVSMIIRSKAPASFGYVAGQFLRALKLGLPVDQAQDAFPKTGPSGQAALGVHIQGAGPALI